jgi:hypothetical protein
VIAVAVMLSVAVSMAGATVPPAPAFAATTAKPAPSLRAEPADEADTRPSPESREKSPIVAASGTPKGFEDLVGPETTLVDLYHGGRFAGTTMATLDQDKIRFHNPIEVVSKIQNLRNAERVLRALSGPIDTNSDRICPEGTTAPGCGLLEPEVAGVIADSSTYKVEIFVHPDEFDIQRVDRGRYLPDSESDLSLVTALAGAFSGSNSGDETFNLRKRLILGRYDDRMRAEGSYSSTDQFFLDTLFLESDREELRYTGGVFRFRGVDSVGQRKMLGAGVTTTTDTRVDLDVAFGQQIVVFLPRRSQIDILRDGRLISSRLYEAGNQTVDTSELPEGAYDIVLRIREIGGETREETQFFTKTESLPPDDSPLYFAEAGVLTDETDRHAPSTDGVPLFRAGTLHRLRDDLGVGADLVTSDNESVIEGKVLYFGRTTRVRGVGLVSREGDFGVSGNLSGTWDKVSYSASLLRNWAHADTPADAFREFDPIRFSRTQGRSSINYQLGRSRVGVQGLWQDTSRDGSSYSYGPTVNWQMFNTGKALGTLSADVTRTRTDTSARLTIRLRRNFPAYSVSGFGGYSQNRREGREDESGRDMGVDVSWRDRDLLPGDLTLTGALSSVSERESASLDGAYKSARGRYSFSADRQRTKTDYTTTYSGNANLNWLTSQDGVVLGGKESRESAVVVKVKGNAVKTKFDVLIDGVRRMTVGVGETIPVLLTPYDTYAIRIDAVTPEFIHFDQEPRSVTLYPGNVATMIWEVNTIKAVFGRVVREDGIPVGFARIHGVVGESFTDELGYFQADMSDAGELTFIPPRGGPCVVDVADLPENQDFARLGTMVCEERLEARNVDVQIAGIDGADGTEADAGAPLETGDPATEVASSETAGQPVQVPTESAGATGGESTATTTADVPAAPAVPVPAVDVAAIAPPERSIDRPSTDAALPPPLSAEERTETPPLAAVQGAAAAPPAARSASGAAEDVTIDDKTPVPGTSAPVEETPARADAAPRVASQPAIPAEPYVVQLAAFERSDAVERYGVELLDSHGDLLARVPLQVGAADRTGGTTVHRLRAGPFLTQEDARRLCRRLQGRAIECLVMRN